MIPTIQENLKNLGCNIPGLKKIGTRSYRAPYVHQTSFWGTRNDVDETFCVAAIVLEKFLKI